MRALLAMALILGGVLLLSACTKEEEGEGPGATKTPAATGVVGSPTPPRDLVRPPVIGTQGPTATAAPAQTAGPQPTVAPQPTVISQPTVVIQPTEVPQPTVVTEPTEAPQPTVVPTAPPPTVVVIPSPTPVPTQTQPPPTPSPSPKPTPTGPVVFRGYVTSAPEKYEPMGGPCGWWYWGIQVEVEDVLKMQQTDGGCGLYSYVLGETIDVLYFANVAGVGVGDYVEVSGEESMFSCACTCCCDGCGFIVDPDVTGHYIRQP
jgi:hypothetical protein